MNVDRYKIKNYIIETTMVNETTTIMKVISKTVIGGIFGVALLIGLLFFVSVVANSANSASRIAFIIAILLVVVNFVVSFRIWKSKVFTWKNRKKGRTISVETDKAIAGGSIGGGILIAQAIARNGSDASQMIFAFTLIFLLLMFGVHFFVIEIYKLYLLQKYCPELKNQNNSKSCNK